MKKVIMTAALLASLVGLSSSVNAAAPFGGADDVNYSKQLWKALEKASFIGEGAIYSQPYKGQHPHGAVLDTLNGKVTVKGTTGPVFVKRNYGGKGVSVEKVANDPTAYLKAVTVMFKRKGYDADNKDWFWAKFTPNGGLAKNPKGMMLAGRVAKGKPAGCIACHTAAPGGDMVFTSDKVK